MTERGKPAQMLAWARQRIVAELDKAQQASANLEAEVATRSREIAKWGTRSDALLFALDALGAAPTRRGRKRTAAFDVGGGYGDGTQAENDAAEKKPKRAGKRALESLGTATFRSIVAGQPERPRGVVQETAAGEKLLVDAGVDP